MRIKKIFVSYILLHMYIAHALVSNVESDTGDLQTTQQDKKNHSPQTKELKPTHKEVMEQEDSKSEASKQESALEKRIIKDYARTQIQPFKSDTLDIRSLFSYFKFYEPWYILPAYYSFSDMYSPDLMRTEIKAQISFRLELLNDVVCKFCAFSFDYTQKIYLQTYNDPQSSPLRDTDLSPGVSFIYKKPIPIANGNGGYFNWFSIGYNHVSNGERENVNSADPRQAEWGGNFVRSKALDRVIFETNYRYKNFNTRIRAWVNISAIAYDGAKTNGDIGKYIGYGDIKFSYTYKNNHFELYLNNIFNNYFTRDYWNWKGLIELGYSYGVSKHYAIYAQYLYGHGDSLYEYSLPVNRIGVGVRLRDF
ncbi:phospholipase A [Helicobacter trogontum]|uniref:phospholipase A n=1 Tax=Helicobacter trogontum TaxID=50960 RepID=UPI0024317DE1|nr:phospholipase A [Helicobacter trogontum]MCI5786435.1 phospholipase A [Helicobacter trogontum]MDY5185447.1 phospholipase A [Helicobacter trogontum]